MGPKPTFNAVEYPPDCKEVSTELSKDELHRRLKTLANVIKDIGQDDEHQKYTGLALHIASEEFLEHQSKDVKLLVACILADVFRIFAPEHPFGNSEKLKEVMMFLIDQLPGLGKPDHHNYKRYFYLLENLTYAKTFTVCLDWETDEVVLHLLNTIFGSLTDKHTDKVVNLLLDALSSVLSDSETVSIKVLDAIFINIIEPNKQLTKETCEFARKLLRRNSATLAPSILNFFNQTLMLGNVNESEVGEKLMDVMFELHQISATILTSIMPLLDQKLKVNDTSERKSVIRLLGKLFAETNSDLVETQSELWQSYMGRYHDIDTEIRVACIEQAEQILCNHPKTKISISEHWGRRHRDADDSVRFTVVQSVINAAKKSIEYVTEDMLHCVKERCLDKKFKIRKEALTGLGAVFRKYAIKDDGSLCDESEAGENLKLQWIQNRILQTYYQRLLDDKFLVERLFLQCIVPYNLPAEDRMKRLFTMYAYIDENSRKAFATMLKSQSQLRKLVKELVDICGQEKIPKLTHQVSEQALRISKHYPDSGNKVAEGLKKFFVSLITDVKAREIMQTILDPKCSCDAASEKSRALQTKLANADVSPQIVMAVKVLLERIAPLLIDQEATDILVQYVCDCLTESCEFMQPFPSPYEAGMKLLVAIAPEYPQAFDSEVTFNNLTEFLKHENDIVSSAALQILMNTGSTLKERFPDTCEHLLQTLTSMAKIGSPRQAKHAVRCLDSMFDNKEELFNKIYTHCVESLNIDSANICTALVTIGQMAILTPKAEFVGKLKPVVSNTLVREILQGDQPAMLKGRRSMENWIADHLVSEETQAKIQAMKMMVRWLHAINGTDNAEKYCTSTLRMLHSMLTSQGDLTEKKKILKGEMSRLRLTAGLCMLKIVHVSAYAEIVSNEQFQALALLINDPCLQVRILFTQKLHKYLLPMKIPLQYMAIFSLCANDRMKDRKSTVKQYIELNVQKRREYLRKHPASNNQVLFSILPDYVIPYAVHLLAHDPDLESFEDGPSLRNIKECLWLLLEPLMKDQASFYTFQRKIFDYIKQTKDAQSPDDEQSNKKMWAVCDLGISIIMQRSPYNPSAESCGTPLLPAKLFTGLNIKTTNKDVYLPKDLIFSPTRLYADKGGLYKERKLPPPEEDKDAVGSAIDVKPKKGGAKKSKKKESSEAAEIKEEIERADEDAMETSKEEGSEKSAAKKRSVSETESAGEEEVITKKQKAARSAAAASSKEKSDSETVTNGADKPTPSPTKSDEPAKKGTRSSARNK